MKFYRPFSLLAPLVFATAACAPSGPGLTPDGARDGASSGTERGSGPASEGREEPLHKWGSLAAVAIFAAAACATSCAPAGPGLTPDPPPGGVPMAAERSDRQAGAPAETAREAEEQSMEEALEEAPMPIRVRAVEILEAAELPPTWEDELAACWARDVRLREEDTQSLQLRLVFSRRGVSLRTVQQSLPISESFRGCLEREVAGWRLIEPPTDDGEERVFPLDFVPAE